ncbi:hypothetical protein ABPG73_016968 [Tetrahymena malaccensis]
MAGLEIWQKQLIANLRDQVSEECPFNKPTLEKLFFLLNEQKPHFKNLEYLNDGAFSLVLKAKNTIIQKEVALKIIDCTSNKLKSGIQALKQEYEMLKKFKYNKHIVQVYDCFYLYDDSYDDEYLDDLQKEQFNNIINKDEERIDGQIDIKQKDSQLLEGWIKKQELIDLYNGQGQLKQTINLKSKLYKIIETCLKPKYTDRKSASELLYQLTKQHKYDFDIYSTIIEEKVEKQVKEMIRFYNNEHQNTKSLPLSEDDFIKVFQEIFKKKRYSQNMTIIGFGCFGIALCTKNQTDKEIVIKIQKVEDQMMIEKEIEIMNQAQSPNVIQFFSSYFIEGLEQEIQKDNQTFIKKEKYVVFELERCTYIFSNYFISYMNMMQQYFNVPFENNHRINRHSQIYQQFIVPFLVYDRQQRGSIGVQLKNYQTLEILINQRVDFSRN